MDFPALGSPINPTSESSFNSSLRENVFLGSPSWANLGERFVEDAKCLFPLPPLPPCAMVKVWFLSRSSFIISPDSVSEIIVPGGISIMIFLPVAPVLSFEPPACPSPALNSFLKRNRYNVRLSADVLNITSPPLPPEPPFGPPF